MSADEVVSTAAKSTVPKVPKWEQDARERLKGYIRNAHKSLTPLVERDANEGDTRLFVTQFLCDALGYDLFQDLTTEYAVKGEFADYGVRIDKQLVAFIEVKRATTKLSTRHLRQVEMYAINEGVEWTMLTNGVDWQVYHLAPAPPKATGASGPLVEVDLTLEVNLLDDLPIAQKIDRLFLISRDSLRRKQIDELWRARRATSPKSLAKVLTSEAVLDMVRRELKKATGHSADIAEIESILRASVIRPDCL